MRPVNIREPWLTGPRLIRQGRMVAGHPDDGGALGLCPDLVSGAGRTAVISWSKTAPVTAFTARTQTRLPPGGDATKRVSTPPVAMANGVPISVRVSAPVPGASRKLDESRGRVCSPLPSAGITGKFVVEWAALL